MGSKRFDNLSDCFTNGADIEITCRNCHAQLIVGVWRLERRMKAMRRPLQSSSFAEVSRRLKCQWCGAKHPTVGATMKGR